MVLFVSCTVVRRSYCVCFSLLFRTLNATDIRKQDIASVVVRVSRDKVGRYVVWDFVRSNLAVLQG